MSLFANLQTRETLPTPVTQPLRPGVRSVVRGKFIFIGEEKFHIRGVTYGTFAPDAEGFQFPSREKVEQDFALMAANGMNAVRTYTVQFDSRQLLPADLQNEPGGFERF